MGRTSGNELKNNRLADGDIFLCQPLFLLKIGKQGYLIPRPSEKKKRRSLRMIILDYKDGMKPEKLDSKAKANMERCANFLVGMVEKYGKAVLEEMETEEQVIKEQQEAPVIDL